MKRVLLGAIIFAVAGCATVGNDISQEDISKIQKGVTTEQSLVSTFGQPSTQTVDSEGNRYLVWSYGHAVAFGAAEGKSLMVKLNNSGTVESYTTSSTNSQPVKLY